MTAKDIILDNIIKLMEVGKLDWTKPWKGGPLPCNYVSKRAYTGVNLLMTMWNEFSSPYYMTFKQIQEKGGTIIKGSHATQLVFWKTGTYEKGKNTDTGESILGQSFLLRYYNVFNAEQITGIEFPKPEDVNKEMADLSCITGLADKIKVGLTHVSGDRAFYSPPNDRITMPMQVQFKTDADYAHTFLHELTHSTGHDTRLGRLKENKEGYGHMGDSYAYEELVAEIGQSFLCAELGVRPDIHNSAAYIQGWAARIKKTPDILLKAAGAAQKAVNYIFATNAEPEPTEANEIQ